MMLQKFNTARFFLGMMMGLIILFAVKSAGMVSAQVQTPSDDEVNRVASQLYCPICDNLSLDVCPLEACQAWRDLIREQLAQGWSEREITDYFVAQYGDRVLGTPPARGLNWLLYLVPPGVVLLGSIMLFSKLRRQPQADKTDAEQDIEDLYLNQVERDLRKLDG